MPGVMSRANRLIPTGDYLDKDELIREQEPMAIKSVVFDTTGSSFGPRWVVSVGPWFEDQEGPIGLVTFTNNGTRQPVFEDLQQQIEDANNEPIGPVVLVKGKSTKGYRFYGFADYDEPGAVAAPAPAPAPEPAKRKPGRPRKAAAPVAATAAPAPSPSPSAPEPEQKPVQSDMGGQEVVLKVGTAICPDCNMPVTGRVLPDEQGNRFIIHPHCPATGKAGVVQVIEEV